MTQTATLILTERDVTVIRMALAEYALSRRSFAADCGRAPRVAEQFHGEANEAIGLSNKIKMQSYAVRYGVGVQKLGELVAPVVRRVRCRYPDGTPMQHGYDDPPPCECARCTTEGR